MHVKIREAHDALWSKFYCSGTNLFYEYEGWADDGLPTPEEVAAGQPNTAGWAAGMEDCCLDAGWILDGLLSAYRVTGEHEWADNARQVWRGLAMLGSVSETPGYIVRGVAPGRTDHYPNSSADQYTAFVYGMWVYAASPVATDVERRSAAEMVGNACRLVESFHDDIPTEDMKVSIYGDTSAYLPDRACRLLQLYKAGHVLTGDGHWADKYAEAVEQDGRKRLQCHSGRDLEPPKGAMYAVYQSSGAWRLLYECEEDADLKAAYAKALDAAARATADGAAAWRTWMPGPHNPVVWWREPFRDFIARIPQGDYRSPEGRHEFLRCLQCLNPSKANDHANLRAAIEAIGISMFAPDDALKQRVRDEGWALLAGVDYSLVRCCPALACLESAYWRGVEAGLFPQC